MFKDLYTQVFLLPLVMFAFYISGKIGKMFENYHNGIYLSCLFFIISFSLIVALGIKVYHRILR
jgi:hypothetical protein